MLANTDSSSTAYSISSSITFFQNQAFQSMAMEADKPHENPSSDFDEYYQVFPITFVGGNHLENGNRIIMPASAINRLSMLEIDYPMLFRLENAATGRHSHCGVLEFTADEGFAFMPIWMMKNMKLREGDLVNVKNTSLPKGTFMKIQPHATNFLNLSDHKSLLEKTLRDFSCLTVGDTTVINHLEEKYYIDIVEAKPSPAISLFETDCEVEFAQPLDYKEPEKKPTTGVERKKNGADDDRKPKEDDQDEVVTKFKPFTGIARRIDGEKVLRKDEWSSTQSKKKAKMEESTAVIDRKTEKSGAEFKPFSGVGRRLDGQQSLTKEDQSRVEEVQNRKVLKGKNTAEETREFQPFTGRSFTTADLRH